MDSGWRALGSLSIAAALNFGCAEEPDDLPAEEAKAEWPLLGCDNLVESYCAAPFPSNVYTVEDANTPTGRRVQLAPELFPTDTAGLSAAPDPWNQLDGFSPLIAISAHFPTLTPASLDMSGAPTSITIERSMEDDSATVILDTETGERIPHFVDLDATGTVDEERMFMIRPAIRLQDNRRYIVAIRSLLGGTGAPIQASTAFAALRDRSPSDNPQVEDRRALYGDIFARLSDAGIRRDSLQLAWDFSTASRENNTGWMVHMRDEALAMIGPGGPAYTIKTVDEDWVDDPEGNIAFRIYLDMQVPMYLDQPNPLASLTFGADGMPDPNPAMPMAEFEVEILIPQSARTEPAALLQYGHGLLGSKEQIQSSHFLSFINEYNYVLFGVDFIGFAEDDEVFIGAMLSNGHFEQFQNVMERQLQGMLNSLVAMRMMKTSFAGDAEYGQYVDPAQSYYLGISQGGIYGGTYMALSTDVERGTIGVPGMPYNLLLSRSVDFDPFFDLVRIAFPDARDNMLLLNYAQMLWDRIEPAGYLPYVIENNLPNTMPHQIFIRAAVGDHQVTTLGAHVMARTLGIPHLDSGVRPIWGLEPVPGPVTGSAYTEYSFGLPEDPIGNTPQRECEDPHGKLRKLDEARRQLDQFFRQGTVQNHCAGGVCTFADMSGCL